MREPAICSGVHSRNFEISLYGLFEYKNEEAMISYFEQVKWKKQNDNFRILGI